MWRFIQGIGGGALLSTSQGILFDAFEPEKRAIAGGMFGMGIVLGPTIGPILGGIIVDNYSWPLIFNINIPFGIIATLLSLRFIEETEEEKNPNREKPKIDYIGIALLAVGIGCLQYVLERGQSDDWFEDRTILLLTIVSAGGLISFVYRQLTMNQPMIQLSLLKNRNLAASNILTFAVGFGLFGSVFIFPVLVQRVLGYTPTDAGFGLVPSAMVAIFVMPIIGKTDAEARDVLNTLQSYVDSTEGLAMLSARLGSDISKYPLDGPIPDVPVADTSQGFARALLAKGKRENMSLRDLYNLTAAARGHWVLCGSTQTVTDTLEKWFLEGAADGFCVMPAYFPGAFDEFVDLVVPELQRRGLYRKAYTGTTLRDHLGLSRPAIGEYLGMVQQSKAAVS